MPNLVMLAGVPGSGKSTWANAFFDLKYKRVSSDEIRMRLFGGLKVAHEPNAKAQNNERVWAVFHDTILDTLAHGVDVLADATHLTRRSRHDVRQHAHATGAKTHLVVFKNVQEALERNALRTADARVPDEVQGRMLVGYRNLLADLQDGERGLYDTVTMVESFA